MYHKDGGHGRIPSGTSTSGSGRHYVSSASSSSSNHASGPGHAHSRSSLPGGVNPSPGYYIPGYPTAYHHATTLPDYAHRSAVVDNRSSSSANPSVRNERSHEVQPGEHYSSRIESHNHYPPTSSLESPLSGSYPQPGLRRRPHLLPEYHHPPASSHGGVVAAAAAAASYRSSTSGGRITEGSSSHFIPVESASLSLQRRERVAVIPNLTFSNSVGNLHQADLARLERATATAQVPPPAHQEPSPRVPPSSLHPSLLMPAAAPSSHIAAAAADSTHQKRPRLSDVPLQRENARDPREDVLQARDRALPPGGIVVGHPLSSTLGLVHSTAARPDYSQPLRIDVPGNGGGKIDGLSASPLRPSLAESAGQSSIVMPPKKLNVAGRARESPGVAAAPSSLQHRSRAEIVSAISGSYVPQVEAISPTPGSGEEPIAQSIIAKVSTATTKTFQTGGKETKDEMLKNITRLEHDITKTEENIRKLKKKMSTLKESSTRSIKKEEVPVKMEIDPAKEFVNDGIKDENFHVKNEEQVGITPLPTNESGNCGAVTSLGATESTPKHLLIAQRVYAENRQKVSQSLLLLTEAGNSLMSPDFRQAVPLYNQPCDTAVYHQNKKFHARFRVKLLKYFRKKHHARKVRERFLSEKYDQLSQEWLKKMEKIESAPKRRIKDGKTREFFERIFPELKKQREDRERITRATRNSSQHANSISSAATIENSFSTGPRSSLARPEGEVDPAVDHSREQEEDYKKMKSYAVVPPMILNAKDQNISFVNNNGVIEDPMAEYKEQLANSTNWTEAEKSIFRTQYLNHPKNFPIIASHLERKTVQDCILFYYQSKKRENYKQLLRKQTARKPKGYREKTKPIATRPGDETTLLPIEQPNVAREAEESVDGDDPRDISDVPREQAKSTRIIPDGTINVDDASSNNILESGKEDKERFSEKGDSQNDLDKNETDGLHNCCVCKNQLSSYHQSRQVTKNDCAFFELPAPTNDSKISRRICHSCRGKSVRKRYTHCPISSCKNPKRRVKKLRPFPKNWLEITVEVRQQIVTELHLSSEADKCCSACFNRIARRINGSQFKTLTDVAGEDMQWAESEIKKFKDALTNFGKDWSSIANSLISSKEEKVNPNSAKESMDEVNILGDKTPSQCHRFYARYKRELGLEALVHQFKKEQTQKDSEKKSLLSGATQDNRRTVSTCESVVSSVNDDDDLDDDLGDMSSVATDEEDNADSSSDTDSAPSPLPDVVVKPKYSDANSSSNRSNEMVPTDEGTQFANSSQNKALSIESPNEMVHSSILRSTQPVTSMPFRERSDSVKRKSDNCDNDSSTTLSADESHETITPQRQRRCSMTPPFSRAVSSGVQRGSEVEVPPRQSLVPLSNLPRSFIGKAVVPQGTSSVKEIIQTTIERNFRDTSGPPVRLSPAVSHSESNLQLAEIDSEPQDLSRPSSSSGELPRSGSRSHVLSPGPSTPYASMSGRNHGRGTPTSPYPDSSHPFPREFNPSQHISTNSVPHPGYAINHRLNSDPDFNRINDHLTPPSAHSHHPKILPPVDPQHTNDCRSFQFENKNTSQNSLNRRNIGSPHPVSVHSSLSITNSPKVSPAITGLPLYSNSHGHLGSPSNVGSISMGTPIAYAAPSPSHSPLQSHGSITRGTPTVLPSHASELNIGLSASRVMPPPHPQTLQSSPQTSVTFPGSSMLVSTDRIRSRHSDEQGIILDSASFFHVKNSGAQRNDLSKSTLATDFHTSQNMMHNVGNKRFSSDDLGAKREQATKDAVAQAMKNRGMHPLDGSSLVSSQSLSNNILVKPPSGLIMNSSDKKIYLNQADIIAQSVEAYSNKVANIPPKAQLSQNKRGHSPVSPQVCIPAYASQSSSTMNTSPRHTRGLLTDAHLAHNNKFGVIHNPGQNLVFDPSRTFNPNVKHPEDGPRGPSEHSSAFQALVDVAAQAPTLDVPRVIPSTRSSRVSPFREKDVVSAYQYQPANAGGKSPRERERKEILDEMEASKESVVEKLSQYESEMRAYQDARNLRNRIDSERTRTDSERTRTDSESSAYDREQRVNRLERDVDNYLPNNRFDRKMLPPLVRDGFIPTSKHVDNSHGILERLPNQSFSTGPSHPRVISNFAHTTSKIEQPEVAPVTLSTKNLIDAIITKSITDNPKSRSSGGVVLDTGGVEILSKPDDVSQLYKQQKALGKASGSGNNLGPQNLVNHLANNKSITLGQGIDAIINEEYFSEGRNNKGNEVDIPNTASEHFNWKHKITKRPMERGKGIDNQPIVVDLEPSPPAAKLMRMNPTPNSNFSQITKEMPTHYESISPPPSKGPVNSSGVAIIHNPAQGSTRGCYSQFSSKPSENG